MVLVGDHFRYYTFDYRVNMKMIFELQFIKQYNFALNKSYRHNYYVHKTYTFARRIFTINCV